MSTRVKAPALGFCYWAPVPALGCNGKTKKKNVIAAKIPNWEYKFRHKLIS